MEKGIADFQGDNFGSIIKLMLIDYREVLFIAPAVNGTVQSSITISQASQFREIHFSSESAGYTETFNDSKHGHFWKKDLSFFVPKDRPEVVDWLWQYAAVPCIGIITNAHGQRKIIGAMDNPLLLSKADLAVKEKVTGLVGRSFSYRNQSANPAFFYAPPQYLLLNDGGQVFQNNLDPILL
ncbi:hypothetical protein SAMN05421780_11416 [Flexibacter flexilis DSM 6793]|uniref:Uncharacterized protein n=1 Tax=Flexibacter flexilis DSM 6793 TaxID=927664 RepID=A0A1I1NCT6_9BACT|nr:hypothetical protein [Flexibacter flexilis]SFC95357.1 hypothetical protein SAMN05421780_11416 [Flexibacter flexilis DSM 6793]